MTFDSSGFAAPTVDTVIRNASTELKTSAVGIVVSVDSSSRIISYLPYPNEAGKFATFSTGETIYSSTSTDHGEIASGGLADEEVARHSGDIIYLENNIHKILSRDTKPWSGCFGGPCNLEELVELVNVCFK